MKTDMYVSSEGELKDPKGMNFEYLVNALSKNLRVIFEAENIERYNEIHNNIEVLDKEIYERLDEYFVKRFMESEEK